MSEVEIAATGTVVHLKGYGMVKVFKIVVPNGDIDYWATNDLDLNQLERLQWSEFAWAIEEYHRGLKQCCGVERAQVRAHAGATQSYWTSDSDILTIRTVLVCYRY